MKRIYICITESLRCISSVQFSSLVEPNSTTARSTPGFPVHHQLPELAQTHVHQIGDAIQPSHPLSSPSPPDFIFFIYLFYFLTLQYCIGFAIYQHESTTGIHMFPILTLIFPSIRVFSNESVLRIRWPKYWSLSFSISPSNEYSGLISFRMA